ncbi:MAG TPA: carboxypeptidase-like regulatory domain-containing protein, partial [Blastocatellia bacterium]|nr:carboxypeptidase-like regulatory domain-containing protein [Blastocatellia bacterium]
MRCFLALILLMHSPPFSQTVPSSQSSLTEPAEITGRVTVAEKPVRGALVLIRSVPPSNGRVVAKDKTDADGRYRITNLHAGRYLTSVTAPALTWLQGNETGREINLDSGETREINFSMTRGGVITGRISDSAGSPVIEQQVSIVASGESPRP